MESINIKKDPSLLKYIISFLITTIIFTLIFIFAYSISYINYQRLSYENNLIKDNLLKLDEISTLFEDEINCSNKILLESSRRLDFSGDKINILETKFEKEDKRVIEQKKIYTQLELKHFNIIKKLNLVCEGNFITILFFYSNKDENKDKNEKISFILSAFKEESPERAMIYSFDDNLDFDIIKKLKERYNIKKIPIIIVNEEDLIELNNINLLTNYLKQNITKGVKNGL